LKNHGRRNRNPRTETEEPPKQTFDVTLILSYAKSCGRA
jgi:hypothetical protein